MNNKKVLVQCCDGTSRSPSVVIAYLMKYYNLSLIESLFYVKNIRKSLTKPNIGFFVQLQNMEMDLYGKISISLPQYSKL
jgi:protein-tyrosine phosphatase